MSQYISLGLLLAILGAKSISLSPELTYQYNSDSEQYSTEQSSIQDYELTIFGQYSSNKLNISTRMGYHLIDGMKDYPSDFTRNQGLPYITHSPGTRANQRNY